MAQTALKDLGWYLNINAIPDLRPGASVNEIVKRALDLDLRQVAEAKANDSKAKTSVNGPLVLQLQKTVNIAVPKDQSENSIQGKEGSSRRLLLMTLTDGNTTYQAVEMQPIRNLSMETPPGTKFLLKGEIPIWKGFLQFFPSNVDILGGVVTKLVSAWELSRQIGSRAAAMLTSQNQRQQAGPGGHGPPAFVPFGQRILNKYDGASTDNFRAMDVVAKEKAQAANGSTDDEDAVDEFSEQRQAAIAKALKDHKPRQGDDKKLAMPDISQLSIATKPASAPPVRAAPVAPVVSSGPDPDPEPRRGGRFGGGGRGRRGRASYEDDYESAAAMGRPSQFRLFDVIQQQPGQEKLKLVAETAALSAPAEKPTSSSGRRGYDDESSGAPPSGGRGGHRGGHRGGRGNWRGRGGGPGGSGSRSSYPAVSRGGGAQPPQLFREGSAASSRGVDSASPTSDGGRGGTGNRDLPPRLKRHQQTSISQSFVEEPGSATSLSDGPSGQPQPQPQQFFPAPQKSRSSTGGGRVGEFGSYEVEREEIVTGAGRSGSRPGPGQQGTAGPSVPLLPTPPTVHASPQMTAIYQPVVTADGATYSAPIAPPETMIPYPGPGYAIQPQLFAPPQFVPNSVASPPPASVSAQPNSLQPTPSQQPQPSLNQGGAPAASPVVNPVDMRPGAYCLARWSDGGYYPVQIISIDPATQTSFVNYYQYNEYQHVPFTALHPHSPLDQAALAPPPPPQPQQVLILQPPAAAMQPGPAGPDMMRHQQHQQQRMMWINPGGPAPLLPPPPPFPGIESFANRLSLPSEQPAFMAAAMPPQIMILNPMGGEQPDIEQQQQQQQGVPQSSNDNGVPVETAVAAG